MARINSTAARSKTPRVQRASAVAFGLTVDQVDQTTEALAHAQALVDLVRWYSAAHETLQTLDTLGAWDKLKNEIGEQQMSLIRHPGAVHDGVVVELLYRAASDISQAREHIEGARRV